MGGSKRAKNAHTAKPYALSADLALYIHWPYCLKKCPYCDFNSHVREDIDQARFATIIRRELATEATRLGRRPLASVFFGGGTPSLMDPSTVAALLDDAARWFDPADNVEITLEANPTSIEAGRLADYRRAGINRVSIGVQSLDEAALRFLGREHSAKEALAALVLARQLFSNMSFDLIYARPGQDLAEWRAELKTALAVAADHLSLYQLTVEPATQFEGLHRQGKLVLPTEESAVALYEATEEECERVGLSLYEISNYARAGNESRHNLAYWRYQEYIGIGPGSHGRVTVDGSLHATRRHRFPETWARLVETRGHGLTSIEPIPALERAREALIMGLRLAEGIDLAKFGERTGRTVGEAVDMDTLARCVAEGYLVYTPQRLKATREGRLRLNSSLAALAN